MEKVAFQGNNESCAATAPEIQDSHYDYLIEIELRAASPNAPQWKISFLRCDTTETDQKALLDLIKYGVGDWTAIIETEREVKVVPPG